ncbi:hypothetical protein E2C01_067889 [Portunus trituberculatus]|uniref:Uncharacterized protein n=1 Tax=Portunus trituberculatus TaxID=210409 RepID=A0A5B7HV23_PORTR|nr:hypothetical protein [Portunus trituberculatus]
MKYNYSASSRILSGSRYLLTACLAERRWSPSRSRRSEVALTCRYFTASAAPAMKLNYPPNAPGKPVGGEEASCDSVSCSKLLVINNASDTERPRQSVPLGAVLSDAFPALYPSFAVHGITCTAATPCLPACLN